MSLLLLGMLLIGACTTSDSAIPTTSIELPTGSATTSSTSTPDDGAPPPTEPAGTGSETSATFEPSDCAFAAIPGQNPNCGYLIVPENRLTADTNTVRLHVAVFPSTSSDPLADPVVYLEGGPGGDALETIQYVFEDNFEPFLENRDVIVFDQRGTGYSEPSFGCPELEDLAVEYLDDILDGEESLALEFEAEQACRDRIAEGGVDFTAYNSVQSAADVADLRVALGYDEWNLYGISYGTKLALTVMRDHPEGVRSVILDSVYAPENDLVAETPANFARALDAFFGACQTDADCLETYPDLEDRFFEVVDQLNDSPVSFTVTDALTLDSYEAALDGYGFMGLAFQSLYSIDAIRTMPRLITDLEIGDTYLAAALVSNDLTNRGFLSVGYYAVVQCHEEAPFVSLEDAQVAVDAFPQFGEYFQWSFGVGPATVEGCELWDAGEADAIDNEPVLSDIPTFVTTGLYDPITPPAWGSAVADRLANAFYREFLVGHAATASDDCAGTLMRNFLADPTTEPSDACIESMAAPTFLNPALAAGPTGYLETTVSGLASVSSVYPEGWEEVNEGVWTRGETDLDTTVLFSVGAPGVNPDLLASLVAGQFGLPSEPSSSYETNGVSWAIYEGAFIGAPVRAAFSEMAGGAVGVLLIFDPAEAAIWDPVLFEILDRTNG